jgi:hypothetical protein
MRSSRLLFVERHYTTVSSYPHPHVHNFRPYRHRPVDLEVSWRRAGDVSHDSGKTLSYNIAQFLRLFQPVQLLDAERLGHTPPPTERISTNTLFPAPLRNPPPQSHSIPKPLHPKHLRNTVPTHLTSHPHANFRTAHWHNGAILISGALNAPEISAAAGGLVFSDREVVARC